MSAKHLLLLITDRSTYFDRSLSHLQVLNMLQVSGSCAHIWDPKCVYIGTKPIHMQTQHIQVCMGLGLM